MKVEGELPPAPFPPDRTLQRIDYRFSTLLKLAVELVEYTNPTQVDLEVGQ